MRALWLVVGLWGCAEPTTATWLLGTSAAWTGFNHRVSHWEAGVDADGAYAAFVGGTSTTGAFEPVPDGCDPDACGELPFVDGADLSVTRARIEDRGLGVTTGSASVDVGAEGGRVMLRLPLPAGRGDPIAWIQGFALSTREPLAGGDACYQPENGWLPRRLSFGVGRAVVEGDEVVLAIDAAFEAGTSGEAMRACMDDVVGRARLAVRVDVLVLRSPARQDHREVSWAQDYPWDGVGEPPEQLPPDPSTRRVPLRFAGRATGWTSLEWRFNQEDAAAGAYLRTLSFDLDPGSGRVDGHATNWSPLTQLSGMSYQFHGEVASLDLPIAGIVRAELDAVEPEVEPDGVVVSRLPDP